MSSAEAVHSVRSNPATSNPQRARVALEAAWEIEAHAVSLIELAAKDNPDYSDYLRVRGLSVRIRELSTVTMLAVDADDSEDIETLRAKVRGTGPMM